MICPDIFRNRSVYPGLLCRILYFEFPNCLFIGLMFLFLHFIKVRCFVSVLFDQIIHIRFILIRMNRCKLHLVGTALSAGLNIFVLCNRAISQILQQKERLHAFHYAETSATKPVRHSFTGYFGDFGSCIEKRYQRGPGLTDNRCHPVPEFRKHLLAPVVIKRLFVFNQVYFINHASCNPGKVCDHGLFLLFI